MYVFVYLCTVPWLFVGTYVREEKDLKGLCV